MGIKHLSLNWLFLYYFYFHSFLIVFCPKRRQNVLSKIWMDFHSQWILIIRIHFSSLKGYIILHHLCFSYHLEIRFFCLFSIHGSYHSALLVAPQAYEGHDYIWFLSFWTLISCSTYLSWNFFFLLILGFHFF